MKKISTTTPPADVPVSLGSVKSFLGITSVDQDETIDELRHAAIRKVEQDCQIRLITQVVTFYFDYWPPSGRFCELHLFPITAINSVRYSDTDGTRTIVAGAVYNTDVVEAPARIWLADGQTWPVQDAVKPNEIEIAAQVGYASRGAVPPEARLAVKMAASLMDPTVGDCSCNHDDYALVISQLKWTGLVMARD